MKPEQINQAIAEACGQHYHRPTPEEIATGSYYQYEPDYYGDLNLMHEAEETLDERLCVYVQNLTAVIYSEYRYGLYNQFALLHATAPQRCKAFLMTFGKWEEDDL